MGIKLFSKIKDKLVGWYRLRQFNHYTAPKRSKIIKLRELTETPGNCFSCGNLKKFTPLMEGHSAKTKCKILHFSSDDEALSDSNHPLRYECECWKQKIDQKVLTYNGYFAGFENR